MRRLDWTLLPWLVFGVGCGAEGEPTPGVTPPDEPAPVVRATNVSALSLASTSHALPGELTGASDLTVATLPGVGTLVGSAAGLYELSLDGLTQIDTTPVTGLAVLEDVGIVVATTAGVSVWSGSLERSPLSDALSTMSVESLARRNDEIWLGTANELYVFAADHLDAFADIDGAQAIHVYDNANRVVVDDMQGVAIGLAESTDSWSTQALADIELDQILPAAGDRVLGTQDGVLFERVPVEDAVAWRRVALTTDEADEGASGVEASALDSGTGALWFVFANEFRRYTGESVEVLERPTSLSTPTALDVTTDGALWVSDGTNLVRFGHDGPNITWANDIQPFAEDNCNRCHVALGIAHPLDTYEAWVDEVDVIIEEVAAARMPQDDKPLVGGNAELIRRWKIGGFE